MYGRKVKLRFLFVSTILLILILTVFLVLKSLEENVVYFQSPSEIKSLTELTNNKIRVGGMVKKNSISMNSDEVNFIITDFKTDNIKGLKFIKNNFEQKCQEVFLRKGEGKPSLPFCRDYRLICPT